jgi:hypothetical protein
MWPFKSSASSADSAVLDPGLAPFSRAEALDPVAQRRAALDDATEARDHQIRLIAAEEAEKFRLLEAQEQPDAPLADLRLQLDAVEVRLRVLRKPQQRLEDAVVAAHAALGAAVEQQRREREEVEFRRLRDGQLAAQRKFFASYRQLVAAWRELNGARREIGSRCPAASAIRSEVEADFDRLRTEVFRAVDNETLSMFTLPR